MDEQYNNHNQKADQGGIGDTFHQIYAQVGNNIQTPQTITNTNHP